MGHWDTRKLFSEDKYRQISKEGNIQSISFQNEPYLGKPTEVFAWLGIPESPAKRVPGMVLIHGGGGKAFRQWVEMWVRRGYAAIAMDLSGRDAEGNRLPDGGPEQDHPAKFSTTAKWEDLWTYHAMAAVIRSNSILRAPGNQPGTDRRYRDKLGRIPGLHRRGRGPALRLRHSSLRMRVPAGQQRRDMDEDIRGHDAATAAGLAL
jgi:hypothetical protein